MFYGKIKSLCSVKNLTDAGKDNDNIGTLGTLWTSNQKPHLGKSIRI